MSVRGPCLEDLEALLEAAHAGVDGKEVHNEGRAAMPRRWRVSLTYGEVHPASFLRALAGIVDRWLAGGAAGRRFLDVGCGLGRAVSAARLLGFRESLGVEIIPRVAAEAAALQRRLTAEAREAGAGAVGEGAVHCADFSAWDFDWGSLAVVFCANLLFDPPLNAALASAARAMEAGSLLIVLRESSAIDADGLHWRCVEALPIATTWAEDSSSLLVYVRL